MDNRQEKHQLAHYEPARSISPIHEMMDRFFNDEDFFRPARMFRKEFDRARFPKVDISENEKEITVIANVPGMSAENIHIDVDNDSLVISGSVEKEKKEGGEGETYYRFEREYGEFRREFLLPSRVNKDAVRAVTKNGVLRITLPKTNDDARKRIAIEDGKE